MAAPSLSAVPQDRQLASILFQTRKGATLSPPNLWMITKIFHFKFLEIAKREGRHPCLMIGHFNRGSRPRESTVTARFTLFQENNPGFFQKINQAVDGDPSLESEVFFFPVLLDNAGNIDDSKDSTTLFRQFICIKDSRTPSIYKGKYFVIDQSKYDELEHQDEHETLPDDKDGSQDETSIPIANGKRRRVDDPATLLGESSSSGAANDAETTRLKAALEEAERVMATKDAAIAERDAETTRLTTALEEAEQMITTKNAEIAGLTEQTAQFQVKLAEVESTFETLSLAHAGHVEAKDAVIALRDEDIKSKDTEIAGLRNIIAKRNNELRTKNTEIADLKEQTAALIVRVNASSEGEANAARIAELEHKVQGVQAELTKVQAELIKVTQRKNDYMKDMKAQEAYINDEMTKQAGEIGVLKQKQGLHLATIERLNIDVSTGEAQLRRFKAMLEAQGNIPADSEILDDFKKLNDKEIAELKKLNDKDMAELKKQLEDAKKEIKRAYDQVDKEKATYDADRARLILGVDEDERFGFKISTLEAAHSFLETVSEMPTDRRVKEIMKLKHEVVKHEYEIVLLLSGRKGNIEAAHKSSWLGIITKVEADETSRMHHLTRP